MNNYLCSGYIYEACSIINFNKKAIALKTKDYCICDVYYDEHGNKYCYILTGDYKGKTLKELNDFNTDYDVIFHHSMAGTGTININNAEDLEFDKVREMMLAINDKYYLVNPEDANRRLIRLPAELTLETIKILDCAFDRHENTSQEENNIVSLYKEIKNTIVGQDEQVKKILTTLYQNELINNEYEDNLLGLKKHLLICGPTGTGKTETIRRIADNYDKAIAIVNATSYSETGYVGESVEDMLAALYYAADGDLDAAQEGILVIDEIDKLAEDGGKKSHVSRLGVQRSLLKILEGNIMNVNIIEGKLATVIPFDTSRLTVIGLGAFAGIIKQDKKITLGFNSVSSNNKEDVDYSKITSKDFVDYGMLPELMGRFTSRVYMHTLKKEDLRNILLFSNESPLILYKEYFKNLNIVFSYDDDFIDEVAEGAYNLDLGARGLKVVLDDVISPYLFEVYAGNIKKIHLKSSNDYKLKHELEENTKG